MTLAAPQQPARPSKSLADAWERRLAAEGLAPIDQTIRGRLVVRTEIITPRPRYVPDPAALALALEAWLAGDRSRFTAQGLALLVTPRRFNSSERNWPRRRARILLRFCRALAEGRTINSTARAPSETCLAYEFLRPLASCLAEQSAQDDDDDARD